MEFFTNNNDENKPKEQAKKAENKESDKLTSAEDGFRYDYDDSSDLK
ncbi:hypothetical protein [Mesobacillus campisalis]|nr:hypothetical protein [Mesobacillus campisalis]